MDRSPAEVFADHARRHELAYQVGSDGRAIFRPRVGPFAWQVSAGHGAVYATTVLHPRDGEPYNLCLVALDEGFRMMSRVEGIAPEDVPVGLRVTLDWADGDPPLPIFRPVEDGGGEGAGAGSSGGEEDGRGGGALTAARPRPPHVARPLRGVAAIAGAVETQMGLALAGLTAADAMADAARAALDDAGLTPDDVDALFASSTQLPWATVSLAEDLGIRPRVGDSTMAGGASAIAHLNHARAMISAGLCEVALIAYGSTQRSVGRRNASVQDLDPWEAPYRPLMPVAAYGLIASRHMARFGTTPEQLAEVAVSARAWAQGNPGAWSREPLTVADVLAAPRIADPLGVKDCCLVTDGAGALVVTSTERARTLRRPPVPVLGAAETHTHRHVGSMPDLTVSGAAETGPQAFAEAGLGPADVDSAQIYDAFTILPVLFLEDLGFCAKGEGGAFISGGRIAPGGELPVNTNGGGLSYGHPGMYGMSLLVEAVRRIRAQEDEIVLAHANGGVLSAQATAVLGAPATADDGPRTKVAARPVPGRAAARRRRPGVRVAAR